MFKRVFVFSFSVGFSAGCAGPGAADLAARAAEARTLTTAAAVHLPPEGRPSCVGVTVRRSRSPVPAGPEADIDLRLSDEEIEGAVAAAGIDRCARGYRRALEAAGAVPEPLRLSVGFGVDEAGAVCAIVQHDPVEPIDARALQGIDFAGQCLKDALFRARFPEGRVEGKERMVRRYVLAVDMTSTSTSAAVRPETTEPPAAVPPATPAAL